MNIPKPMIDKENPCKTLIFKMWNGLTMIKFYNNHVI
jgi:hypothetical protein